MSIVVQVGAHVRESGICQKLAFRPPKGIAFATEGGDRGCGVHIMCRSDDSGSANDNAVSALGKVLQFRRDCVEGTPLVATWLNALPIRHDLAEAHVAHAQLVRFVEASDPRCITLATKSPRLLSWLTIRRVIHFCILYLLCLST